MGSGLMRTLAAALAAMLLGEEREVDQPGDVLAGRPHAEDATLLLRPLRAHARRC